MGSLAKRWITAVATTAVFAGFATVALSAAVSVSPASAHGRWTPPQTPHFIRPQFIATSPHYTPLDVPVATKAGSSVSALSESPTGEVQGTRGPAPATAEVIPAGVVITVDSVKDVGLKTGNSTTCAATVTGRTDCTLRAALEAATNLGAGTSPTPVTVTVPAGLYVLTSDLRELTVSNHAGVTINGAGQTSTTIEGNHTTRVLGIDPQGGDGTSPIAITGLTITGGEATLTAQSTDDHGEVVSAGCGGGIDQPGYGSILELDDVTVTNNIASDAGGGICSNGTLYARSTSITDNTVAPTTITERDDDYDVVGGGMVIGYTEYAAASLVDVTITGNTINTTTLAEHEYWFGAGGGLAVLYGSDVTITGSKVNSNTVTTASTECADFEEQVECGVVGGGGLFTVRANVKAVDTTFSTNTVSQNGKCTEDCEFAAIGGGTLNFGGTEFTSVTVDNNKLSSGTPGGYTMNSAEGGGIDTYDPMVLTNSEVEGNSSIGAADATDECTLSGGGGIFAGSPGFVMTGTTVAKNTVVDGAGGGVVAWDPDSYITISPITDYTSGDVLSNDVVTDNSSKATWTYATNPDPYDFGSAGGIDIETGEIQINDLTVSDNTATGWVGGMWVTEDTLAQVTDSTISGNSGVLAGGALVMYGSNLKATNSTVADNSSTGTIKTEADSDVTPGGGGILVREADANLLYDTVSGNTSATSGGGVEVDDAGITSTGTIIAGNHATGDAVTSPSVVGGGVRPRVSGGREQDCNVITEDSGATSGGWNISGDASCLFNRSTDQTTVTARLGPLGTYGGPTQTMVPDVDSPAIGTGSGPACPATDQRGTPRPTTACDVGADQAPQGYYVAGADGGVYAFGGAPFYGSAVGDTLAGIVTGIAVLPTDNGYWLVTSEGKVVPFGTAVTYGNLGGININAPIVGIESTPTGGGYWLVGSDGGVYAFGDAGFYGSTGGITINAPIVGMAADPDGTGYWLVGSDGGVYAFGSAPFYGSTGGITLNAPIQGIASTPTGNGYWLTASDGGVFAFGAAPFYGSEVGKTPPLHAPVDGITPTNAPGGYWLVGTDGGVFSFGDAPFGGSLISIGINTVKTIVGIATA